VKFLVSVIDSATGSATPAEMAAIDEFNDALRADGHWVFAGGLTGPSEARLVDGRGPEPVVTEGSLHEGAEYRSGFWILEAEDIETALRLAGEGSRACHRRVEVRALL